jgi:hypothetical protein
LEPLVVAKWRAFGADYRVVVLAAKYPNKQKTFQTGLIWKV